MNWPRRLLPIDSLGGLSVGLVMLLLSNWLSDWYGFSRAFVRLIASANLTYGCYSFFLLVRAKRSLSLIILLVTANLGWALLCVRWAFVFRHTASPLGLAHLLAEALFVGGLALLEWRYRDFLTKPTRLDSDVEPD